MGGLSREIQGLIDRGHSAPLPPPKKLDLKEKRKVSIKKVARWFASSPLLSLLLPLVVPIAFLIGRSVHCSVRQCQGACRCATGCE